MLKRVRKEVSQSTLISFDEADETIICVSGISTRIKISSSYPFSAPKLINCSWKLRSENDPIVWVAVLLRREKNRLFFQIRASACAARPHRARGVPIVAWKRSHITQCASRMWRRRSRTDACTTRYLRLSISTSCASSRIPRGTFFLAQHVTRNATNQIPRPGERPCGGDACV